MKIFQDINANRDNIKGALFMVSFRVSHYIRMNKVLLLLFFLYPIFHTIFFNWFLGFDIPLRTKIGSGCTIYHGNGLVVNADTIIGNNCVLRHCSTFGNKLNANGQDLGSPIIGDNCEFGAHVILIGPIKIGDNSSIGAGTLITKNIPSDSIAYGSPLIIKTKS